MCPLGNHVGSLSEFVAVTTGQRGATVDGITSAPPLLLPQIPDARPAPRYTWPDLEN